MAHANVILKANKISVDNRRDQTPRHAFLRPGVHASRGVLEAAGGAEHQKKKAHLAARLFSA
jgi:hypothetical protein